MVNNHSEPNNRLSSLLDLYLQWTIIASIKKDDENISTTLIDGISKRRKKLNLPKLTKDQVKDIFKETKLMINNRDLLWMHTRILRSQHKLGSVKFKIQTKLDFGQNLARLNQLIHEPLKVQTKGIFGE